MKILNYLKAAFTGVPLCFILASFFTLLTFDVLWCYDTTFRALNQLQLWSILPLATLILSAPYLTTGSRPLQIVVLALADIFLISNLMYCRTYFSSIPVDSYFMASNLKDFLPSVADSMRLRDLLLPLITVITGWLVYSGRVANRWKARPRMAGWLVAVVLAIIPAAVAIGCSGGFRKHYSKLKEGCYYITTTTPIYTPVGDIIYELMTTNPEPTADDHALVENWMAEHKRLMPHAALPDTCGAGKCNLVIILCESLESWVVDRTVDGVEVTPVLNALIADSTTLYCDKVVTQVGNGRSIDCQLLLNAGMLPMEKSVYSMTHPNNRYYTLNQALAERNGARSMILTGDNPVTWNQLPISRAFGIDTLIAKDSWRNDELVGKPAKLSDGSFFRQAVEKLQSGELWPDGTNAFMMFITYSGHNPFRLPEKLKTVRFDERYPERMRDYMEMAHYTDASLKPLIDYLKSRPDWDETLVVITGDHEGLAKNRAEIRRASKEAAEIVDSLQLTPFIVLNSPVAGRYTKPMGQVDMYSTLLNLMGLDNYEWTGMGQSIFAPGKPEVAIVSMTGEVVGDTTALQPSIFNHMRNTRSVSDRIIKFDLLKEGDEN